MGLNSLTCDFFSVLELLSEEVDASEVLALLPVLSEVEADPSLSL
jgi:hypothetical protein